MIVQALNEVLLDLQAATELEYRVELLNRCAREGLASPNTMLSAACCKQACVYPVAMYSSFTPRCTGGLQYITKRKYFSFAAQY